MVAEPKCVRCSKPTDDTTQDLIRQHKSYAPTFIDAGLPRLQAISCGLASRQVAIYWCLSRRASVSNTTHNLTANNLACAMRTWLSQITHLQIRIGSLNTNLHRTKHGKGSTTHTVTNVRCCMGSTMTLPRTQPTTAWSAASACCASAMPSYQTWSQKVPMAPCESFGQQHVSHPQAHQNRCPWMNAASSLGGVCSDNVLLDGGRAHARMNR